MDVPATLQTILHDDFGLEEERNGGRIDGGKFLSLRTRGPVGNRIVDLINIRSLTFVFYTKRDKA